MEVNLFNKRNNKRHWSLAIAIIIIINITVPFNEAIAYEIGKSILINNNDFEENLNYWIPWFGQEQVKISLDESDYKSGTKSLKMANESTVKGQASLAQRINVKEYVGKTVKISQWMKSKNLLAKIQVRAKFLDIQGTEILPLDAKNVYIVGDTDWELKQYYIDIPNNINIDRIYFEYTYDGTGTILIDNVQNEIIETNQTNNKIKNGNFEEELSYWEQWSLDEKFKVEIDNKIYKDGGKSLKLYGNSTNNINGILAQKIDVKSSLGKTINYAQWIKTKGLLGSLQIRTKFLDAKGYTIGKVDNKDVYIQGDMEWTAKEYLVDIPNDINIVSAKVEITYNAVGEVWFDDIKVTIQEKEQTLNILKNGGLEQDFNYWGMWSANTNFGVGIDNTQYHAGKNSLKLYSKDQNASRGIISQIVNIGETTQKSLKIGQWLKTEELKSKVELRVKFLDSSGNAIGDVDLKEIIVANNQEWTFSELAVNIPENKLIKQASIDYIYSSGTGCLRIDDINVEIVEKIIKPNLFKNGNFEEALSYWGTWKDKGEFNVAVDKDIKYEGDYSLKISSNNDQPARGVVSQTIEINDDLQGQVINVKQLVKTQDLIGEEFQVRIKYNYMDTQVIINTQNLKALDVKSTGDWKEITYDIFLPKENKVNDIIVEYIFENCKGAIWLDDIVALKNNEDINENILVNGGFESTINNNGISRWKTFYPDNKLSYQIDGSDRVSGSNSLKITSLDETKISRIEQNIDIFNKNLGDTIKISEWIKSNTKNKLYVNVKFVDDNWNEVEKSFQWNTIIDGNNAWKLYSRDMKIPENKNITKLIIEYKVNQIKGDLCIDDVKMEPYIATQNINNNTPIIEMTKGQTQNIQLGYMPSNSTHKKVRITSDNENIVVVKDNEIKAINKGSSKIKVELIYEGLSWEIPVSVDLNNGINVEKLNTINISGQKYVEGKINVKSGQTDLKYSVFVNGRNNHVSIDANGDFRCYPSIGFNGEDYFVIKIEDAIGNVAVAHYIVKGQGPSLSSDKSSSLIALVQNQEAIGKINLPYDNDAELNVEKEAENGTFIIHKSGNYTYKPKLGYTGYDTVKIKLINSKGNESTIEVVLYVSLSAETISQKLNISHPRIIAKDEDFNRIKVLIKDDENSRIWYDKLKKNVESIVESDIIPYNKSNGLKLDLKSKDYIESLGFMYKLTADRKYAHRAWLEIQNICNYQDWNEGHFLDTATLSLAAGLGYDWLYDYLDESQRKFIEESIINKGLNKAKVLYDEKSGFTVLEHNWNIVCNSSLMVASLAIANNNNTKITLGTVENASKSIQRSLVEYYKDGSSFEGPGYWEYATQNLMYAISTMESSLGIKNPFYLLVDYNKMAEFSPYITGMSGSFNYSDDNGGFMASHYNMWLAKVTNKQEYTQYSKLAYEKRKIVSIYDLLWYNPEAYGKGALNELDKVFDATNIVSMRSSLVNDNGTYVGLKGGQAGTNHGDLDIGTFVFDALGVRWATDLGIENYNVPGYWDIEPLGQRWQYYKKRAEGHNTLTIGTSMNEDQVIGSNSKIIESNINGRDPYTILDMTSAYSDKAVDVTRKIGFTNNKKDLIIEDNFVLKKQQEVAWQMNTRADVVILEDGKTLLLEQDGKKLKMIISSDCNLKIQVLEATPSINSPNTQQEQNAGVKKIVAKVDTVKGNINIKMIPLGNHNKQRASIANGGFEQGLVNWDVWDALGNLNVKLDNIVKRQGINSVKINSGNTNIARGTLSQIIDISNHQSNKFKLSQWIKTKDLVGNLVLRFTFINKDGSYLEGYKTKVVATTGSQDWNLVEVEEDIPANIKGIKIDYLYDSCIGDIWIDEAKQVFNIEDINEDGIVDILDLAFLAQQYNEITTESIYGEYDMNKDNIIDIFDLVILSKKL